MSISNIKLGKFLVLACLPQNKLISKLKEDIRNEAKASDGGGDFYIPFWSDAKDHVSGISDLHETTNSRIVANHARSNLYPKLRDGFLEWWNEKRRWSNQAFDVIDGSIKGSHNISALNATIRVGNTLAISVDDSSNRVVYPYFGKDSRLEPEMARVALWVMSSAMQDFPIEDMRILDVFRAASYSVDDVPLNGNEEDILQSRFAHILRLRDNLSTLYP